MEDVPLEKISITGPSMAAIMQQFASSSGDCDGLLFGHFRNLSLSNLRDDDDNAGDQSDSSQNLIATITGHLSSGVPQSFYDSTGNPNFDKLCRIVRERNRDDSLIGWFVGRRQTDLRPSMREFSVTHSLNSSGPRSKFFQTLAQIQTQTLGSCSSHFRTPCVFILFSGSFSNQAIHTHEYRAFQFRGNGDNGFFESKSLDIVNIGPAFRSHYNVFSPNSSFPWLSSETRGLKEEMGDNFRDTARKSLNQLRTESTDGTLLNQGLDLCAEGFSVGRLSRLMGPEATNYTSELEDLYKKMLLKLELLARQVEKSSYQVLDQENRNIKLRCKLGGLE